MRRIAFSVMMALSIGTPVAARECDRTCATQTAEAAFTTLQTGQPGKVLPRSVRITENGRNIRLADSQLFAIRRITARQTFVEAGAGVVGITGAAEAWGGPAIFAVRVQLKGDRVSEVETLVVRRTEASVFAPETFRGDPETGRSLSPANRNARLDILAIADAWLDGVSAPQAQIATDLSACRLVSNGAPVVSACSDATGLLGAAPLRDRRVVLVDEDQGLAWAWAVADLPDLTSAIPGEPQRLAPRSVLFAARLRIEGVQVLNVDLVQRNLSPGATFGWAPPKTRK